MGRSKCFHLRQHPKNPGGRRRLHSSFQPDSRFPDVPYWCRKPNDFPLTPPIISEQESKTILQLASRRKIRAACTCTFSGAILQRKWLRPSLLLSPCNVARVGCPPRLGFRRL